VFKTFDGGTTWVKVSGGLPPASSVIALVVDPVLNSTIYATISEPSGQENGVFKSADGGERWVAMNNGLTKPNLFVSGLAIDPASHGTLYVASTTGVFKTTNGAESWNPPGVGIPLGLDQQRFALAIDPDNPGTLYAGGYGNGVFKTTDGGTSWVLVSAGLPEYFGCDLFIGFCSFVDTLAIDPHTPSTVYAGTSRGGIFKTMDGGESWLKVSTGLPSTIVIDPGSPSTVYAASALGVFKTTNGGTSWSDTSDGLPDSSVFGSFVAALVIDPHHPGTVYAGTGEGVFKTTNGGTEWDAASEGLLSPLSVLSLAIDPLVHTTLYAGTFQGVFRSSDAGRNWMPASAGINSGFINALAIDPVDSATVYAGTVNGVFRTTDRGERWISVSTDLGGQGVNGVPVNALAVDPTNPTILYAGTTSVGVFKTKNGGGTWLSASDGLPSGSFISALVIDPTNSQTVYAGVPSASGNTGVFRTIDGGESWIPLNNGLPPNSDVGPLAIEPNSPTTLYIGITPGSVFKTITDGGASWVPTNRGLPDSLPSSLAIDPADPETVYAGFDIGVFGTTDGGATWTSLNLGLASTDIQGLAIDPSVPTRVYAATSAGVFAFGSCGDGIMDPGELCEKTEPGGTFGLCCTSDCQFAPRHTPCRASAGDCDAPDFCSGIGADCFDVKLTAVLCREAVDICDLQEACDGGHDTCPADGFASATTLCRPSEGSCDPSEFCSGSAPHCPPDVLRKRGERCGDPGNVCDGIHPDCQSNCGNATVEAELGEKCDDGVNNGTPRDSCRRDCQLKCGDGTVDPLEQCDGGQHCTPSCRLTCTDDADCCAGDANCNGNNACTRAVCEDGLCATEPGCAGDACTGSSDLAGVEGCFRQLGGARCRSPRDRKLANRVNRQLADRLAELRTLPDLCGSSRTQKRIPKLLKRVRRKLGQLQLLVARNAGDPECYNELTGFAPASDGRLAFLGLQVQQLGVQAICQPAKPGA
jgi:photosystem II stability/assembly factor-like uncharacterized protein